MKVGDRPAGIHNHLCGLILQANDTLLPFHLCPVKNRKDKKSRDKLLSRNHLIFFLPGATLQYQAQIAFVPVLPGTE